VTPYDLLRDALGRDAARPFVTFYDDATGERVELSVATYANWVAKTANLLQDDLAVEPGERVGVALPAHWQATVVALACWAIGAAVVPAAEGELPPPDVDVAVASADRLPDVDETRARAVVGLSLRPLGGPLVDPPAGVLDFATEVPPQADRFEPYARVGDGLAGWRSADGELTLGQLVERGRAAGLEPGARVLSTMSLTTLDGVVAGLLAPLAVHGSVVLCRNLDHEQLAARRAAERVTVEVH
jgi:uncharacterized protein (TIGR03089 family)